MGSTNKEFDTKSNFIELNSYLRNLETKCYRYKANDRKEILFADSLKSDVNKM